jgi:hypothetical protein
MYRSWSHRFACQLAARIKSDHTHAATRIHAPGRWRLVDRLGEPIVLGLLQDSRTGITRRGLTERYGISLGSVKRLLRPQ